ncbi:hypothetical protein [Nocardioides bizhenqiangii]|uniref:Uncharacterized protein n=1 Tax=Nocardioides bizhenqiangii TaxID=3095076 RepID=A0ABZ0ZXW8_9ACTN|nr:hypothetical protein [Nocardioides sp. HM61]WQQ28088.1 hypothetical protein SHK19_07605 [Nocardioides sp. HM61]
MRRSDRNGSHEAWTAPDGSGNGSAPTVVPSNLGPAFDERVGDALRHQQPRGQDAEYDLVRDHFDVAHYLLQAPGVMDDPSIDPVRHFLRLGPAARCTPDPNFSTESYLKRHPQRRDGDVHPYAAWLTEGKAAGEVGEPVMGIEKLAKVLGISPEEVAAHLAERRSDVHRRLHHGKLGEMFAKAVEVEPLIGDLWAEIARPRMMPIPWLVVADQLGALYSCQEVLGFKRARVVLVVEDPAHHLAVRLLRALQTEVEAHDIVVVTTAPGTVPSAATPPGVRRVDFATSARGLGPLMAQQVLVELLRSLCVDAIVGVGSRLLLDALTPYGRALRSSERVYLGFAGLRRGRYGQEVGASVRYFYRHVELVDGVIADTASTAVRLVEDYQLPDDVAAKVRSVADDRVLAEMVGRLLEGRRDDA